MPERGRTYRPENEVRLKSPAETFEAHFVFGTAPWQDSRREHFYQPPPNALYSLTSVICLSLIALLSPIWASK